MKEKNNSFLGIGWAFPPAFNLDRGTVEMVEDEEDIKQSLQIIINTIRGERIMFPDFGCSLRDFVFESNDPTHTTMLADAIYDALLFHEPRIKDINVKIEHNDIKIDPQNDGFLLVHITYKVINTNTRNNIVFPFYFNEGTNL